MSLSRWQRSIVTEAGDTIAEAEIEVFDAGESSKPDLFQDSDGSTALTNPFNADGSGFAAFYVAGGRYDIAVNGTVIWTNVALGTVQSRDVGTGADEVPDNAAIDSRGFAQSVDSVEDLRAASFPDSLERIWLSGYYGVGTPGGGPLYIDRDDSSSEDNGGTVFVTEDGLRVKRPESSSVCMTMFGVVPDGSTENNEALEAAYKYSAEKGAELVIPAGVVMLEAPFVFDAPGQFVRMRGVSRDASILRMAPTDLEALGSAAFIDFTEGTGAEWSDFTSDMNRDNMTNLVSPPNANQENIDLQDMAVGSYLDNLKVVNTVADAIDLDNTTYCTVRNCYVSVAGKDGIHVSSGSHNNDIRNNYVELCEGTQRGGITQSENAEGYNTYVGNTSRDNVYRNYDIRADNSGSTAVFAGNASSWEDGGPGTGDNLEGVIGEGVAIHLGELEMGVGVSKRCIYADRTFSGDLDETIDLSGGDSYELEFEINLSSGSSLYLQINDITTNDYEYITMDASGEFSASTSDSILVVSGSARKNTGWLKIHAGAGGSDGPENVPIAASVWGRSQSLVQGNVDTSVDSVTSMRLFTDEGKNYSAIRVYKTS